MKTDKSNQTELPQNKESGDRSLERLVGLSLDDAIHTAAKMIIGGFAANGRHNPEWIEEAENIIRREICPVFREALLPMLLNPSSPRVKRIWPAAAARARELLESMPNVEVTGNPLSAAHGFGMFVF